MDPLDILGVCKVRRGGVSFPHRNKLAFVNAVVTDNASLQRTVVQTYSAPSEPWVTTIGDNDWSDTETIGADVFRYYDADYGAWFSGAPEFSAAREIYLSNADAADSIIHIRSLPASPAVQRKLLLNLGPSDIFLIADGSPTTFRLPVSYEAAVKQNTGVHLLWDAVDGRWLAVL